MARKSFKSLLRPIDGPRRNPVRFWINSKQNHYELWKRKAERAETEEKRIEYEANAYVTDEGFYHYCTEILGYDKFHPPFHSRMTNFIVGKDLDYYFVKRKRLLEGFRGCFKSSALSIGYTTWLVAREYVLSRETRALLQQIHAVDEDGAAILSEAERVPLERERQALVASGQHLDGVNIKIGLASEELTLPADHVGASCAVMEGELYCKYFGEHAPKDRKKGAKWGRTGATSVYRTNIALRDPTIWTISLDAPRTGRHFDVIIPDDLQAERSSASRNQLRETWRLYKLLFPLLDPPEISHYSEIVMGATRWHEQDIYGKIEAENEHHAKQDRTEILKLPVCTEAEVATCPTIYKTEAISSLKAGGIDEYNTQYLLKPRSGKTQAFKPEWIRYYGPGEIREVVGQGYYVTGADFCWVEAAKRNDSGQDHSVVMTWFVAPGYKWYLIDSFREQCTRLETLEVVYRQKQQHSSIGVGFSVSDRRHVQDEITRFELQNGTTLNPVWVSDLASTATGDDSNKARKIVGVLQPLFQGGQVFIPMGQTWFEEEIKDCPMGLTDDGLDAFVCAVGAALPPVFRREDKPDDPPGTIWVKHREALMKGRPIHLDGTPIRPEHRFRNHSGATRSFRRPRNRTT